MKNKTPTDIDIYRAANQLIKQYGENAEFEAASLADAMLDKGDLKWQRLWKRVLMAISELQQKEPGRGEAVH